MGPSPSYIRYSSLVILRLRCRALHKECGVGCYEGNSTGWIPHSDHTLPGQLLEDCLDQA